MKKTPKSLRLQIGIFGRTNVGKSTFLNYITSQDVAITSHLPGTTTDVVEKTMELLPLGPVVFLDTAGVDDISALSALRTTRTKKIFNRADVFVLLTEQGKWGRYEEEIAAASRENKAALIAVVNKADLSSPDEALLSAIKKDTPHIITCSCKDLSNRDKTISELKEAIINACPEDFLSFPPLVSDLFAPDEFLMLVVPVDLEAPKGRIILPQVQTLRDSLDGDRITVVVKETKIAEAIVLHKKLPGLVVCDSQVVDKMVKTLPAGVRCTTFSILFARFKGDLAELVMGVAAIRELKDGDRVLISESCSHHPIGDDIGRVKLPRLLKNYASADISFDVCSGRDYPCDLEQYKIVLHCGGCMLTRREMLNRIRKAKEAGIPITNYGVVISFLQGVLDRTLSPFPDERQMFRTIMIKEKRGVKFFEKQNKNRQK